MSRVARQAVNLPQMPDPMLFLGVCRPFFIRLGDGGLGQY